MNQKYNKRKTRGSLEPFKYLTTDQIAQLREYLRRRVVLSQERHWCVRAAVNEAIIDTLLNTGVRAAELCALQMQDLPHCHGKPAVFVREGKGRIPRTIVVSMIFADRLTTFVKQYRKNSKPRSPLFVNQNGTKLSYRSLYSRIITVGKRSGIGRLTPHMFRHTYATKLFNRGKDLLFVRDQLGHSNLSTTTIYSVTETDERLRIMEGFDL